VQVNCEEGKKNKHEVVRTVNSNNNNNNNQTEREGNTQLQCSGTYLAHGQLAVTVLADAFGGTGGRHTVEQVSHTYGYNIDGRENETNKQQQRS
jgi:hypothetical protein